ncbi:MAG: branched-chain amino acid ABC transporter permease [Dehalococcoidia bacterium]
MDTFLQLTSSGIAVGILYAVIALGFVIIYKATRVFNFAQGSFVLLGGFVFYSMGAQLGLPVYLAFPATFVAMMAVGWLTERLTMRPLIGQPILAPVMVTLAIIALIQGIVLLLWGSDMFPFAKGSLPTGIWRMGQVAIEQVDVLTLAVGLLFIAILSAFFKYTRPGLAMRVTAEDHTVAQNLGIPVKQVFSRSWMIAGLVGAIGGVFLGGILGGMVYNLDTIALKAVAVVLVGGLESITGVIVAGLIIGLAEAFAGGYLSTYLGGGIQDVAPFVILMVILLIKPYGLFGLVRIERL